MRHWLRLLVLTACFAASGHEAAIGNVAPEWTATNWINSAPLELEKLRGKVVLVRWWTAPDCRYCTATAPALNEFHKEFSKRGLVVVGFYHHKSDEPLDVAEVKRHTKRFGFQFPVAIDPEWCTLKKWWLHDEDRDWTSVSFLIDRDGVVRHIHRGGQYVKGDHAYAQMRRKIEELLRENKRSAPGN